LPASITQWWQPSGLANAGAKNGFFYEILGNGEQLKYAGPSKNTAEWGGRSNGIVRVDGSAFTINEFWQRQPRKILVTDTEVVLSLFEGSEQLKNTTGGIFGGQGFEPLRNGEAIWDRFGVYRGSASDQNVVADTEALPALNVTQRNKLIESFVIAPQVLHAASASPRRVEINQLLSKYTQWQGTSWNANFADPMPGREWPGDSNKTTLFSQQVRSSYTPEDKPLVYNWRDWGDVFWSNSEPSSNHYDWTRSALKFYLKTGDKEALRWGLASARHRASTDHIFTNAGKKDWIGFQRYEIGDHGDNQSFVARPSHTWVEGLYLAYNITKDRWFKEVADESAEAAWRYWGGTQSAKLDACGETRIATWPMLTLLTSYRETKKEKYFTKAKELMQSIVDQEQQSGGEGYIKSKCDWGNTNNAQPLMEAYSIKPISLFYETAKIRGKKEWRPEFTAYILRMANWVATPYPSGPKTENNGYSYLWCKSNTTCVQPSDPKGEVAYQIMFADLFTLAHSLDSRGISSATKMSWYDLAIEEFKGSVNNAAQPLGIVGFLTNQYPGTESKILGWMQQFNDRTARLLASKKGY